MSGATAEEQLRELTARLAEAEETLRAVRCGEIDAFIVHGPEGEQVYALRSAEQPYRNLVEDMLEGAAILTTDGDIVYCNRRFADQVGLPLEEVVGGPFDRFVNRAQRGTFRALLSAGSGKRRTQLTTAHGRVIDVFLSLTTSVCDEIERRNLIVTDLSELLDAQSSRARAEQQSQAKDEFMAMLAHELRNPLSAITAAIHVLESANGQQSSGARARSIIARQVLHLSRLVDDLLDVGRVVTGKIALERQPIDLGDLLLRTIAVFCEREPRHHFQVDTVPVWIEGDAVRIEQIISNIVGNAVKYTQGAGHIRVGLTEELGEAVLQVADDGLGITAELLPNIFDLFVQGERTLERAQGGLGIGLTLVRRLVGLHRGSVVAASEGPGRGSLFTVRLPRIEAPSRSKSGDRLVTPVSAARRVLIVEDNRDAREMFRMLLELSGHQVLEAADGCRGLELLQSELPDIAFIDVGLPGIDGYEIARRFRSTLDGADVLLVALTGYGTPEALERSRRAGFDHHVIKPAHPDRLEELLNSQSPARIRRSATLRRSGGGSDVSSSISAMQSPASTHHAVSHSPTCAPAHGASTGQSISASPSSSTGSDATLQ